MKDEKIAVEWKTAHSQRLKSFRTSAALILTALMLVVAASTGAIGQTTFKTLLSFDSTDGIGYPGAGLVQSTNGYLYGTTSAYDGTVFKITTSGTPTTLHTFDGADGADPFAALVQDTNGNLYGTTALRGSGNPGCGTVFQITPSDTLETLVRFNGADGCKPLGALVPATNGYLYGTTQGGTDGTVFEVTASGTLTTLHSFDGADGEQPDAALVQATDGNFYGTTPGGGKGTPLIAGTVFKISPSGKLTTLYSFGGGAHGAQPEAGLIQAADGYLYGTTAFGGSGCFGAGCGTVFKISPGGKLTTLHIFDGTDGAKPEAGLVQASDGNLYGTTYEGGNGCSNGCGTIFQMSPSGTFKTLHSFDGMDGAKPEAGLVQDTNGTFYGTTLYGGAHNYGTIFSLSVAGLGPFVETQTASGQEDAKIGILGQGFSGSSVVKFGGTKAATIVLTGTTFITATVPAGALTGSVTVTTGTTTLTSSKIFDVLPTLTSFTPESGPVGTSVTITGTGLKQTSKVTFDGESATFTVNSDTEVTADVPTGAVTGKIAVTTKGGSATSATSYTVN